jgi:transcriptional regulator with XRE-family HTH domain
MAESPIATRLINLSVQRGWSMRHLGRLSGVDYSYLARLKRGAADPNHVSHDVLIRLAGVLGVELTLEQN